MVKIGEMGKLPDSLKLLQRCLIDSEIANIDMIISRRDTAERFIHIIIVNEVKARFGSAFYQGC